MKNQKICRLCEIDFVFSRGNGVRMVRLGIFFVKIDHILVKIIINSIIYALIKS